MALRPVAVLFMLAAAASAVALLVSSCSGLPGKTCYGDRLNAFAADAGSTECTSCMQRQECCDVVGECADDPGCAADFRNTQQCLGEAGAAAEAYCKGSLDSGKSQAVYACVRKPCSESCGIPSCDIDPAVVLLVDPSCDRCLTGACCDAINACYGSRQCKLFVECVTKHCPDSLGASFASAATQPRSALTATVHAECGEAGAAPSERIDPGPCLDECLDEFVPATGSRTQEDIDARCLAFGVFGCGVAAGCGTSCSDAGAASSDLPYPSDEPDAAP